MMEMLLFNFFGAEVDPTEIREKYIPAIDKVIEHIVRDTIDYQFDLLRFRQENRREDDGELADAFELFEKLTDLSMAPRAAGKCAWARVDDKWADDDLRSNVKVFLAGALEATTSYAAWAVSHLARNSEYQNRVFQEVESVESFRTDAIDNAVNLQKVLRETLRLTPSLYFLPRRAVSDTWITLSDDSKMLLPAGTHILLDVWHSNRIQEYWGEGTTGFDAEGFTHNDGMPSTVPVVAKIICISDSVMGRGFVRANIWGNWRQRSSWGGLSNCSSLKRFRKRTSPRPGYQPNQRMVLWFDCGSGRSGIVY